MKLGDYLIRAMLSQNKFAAMSGITQTVVSRIVRIENRTNGPSKGKSISSETIRRVVLATDGAVSERDLTWGGDRVGEDV